MLWHYPCKSHLNYQIWTLSFWSKLNVKAFTAPETRVLPNALKQSQSPVFRLQAPVNANSAKHHHSLFCISCYQNRYSQNLILIFPHKMKGAFAHSDSTDIGGYIRSRQIRRIYCEPIWILFKFNFSLSLVTIILVFQNYLIRIIDYNAILVEKVMGLYFKHTKF